MRGLVIVLSLLFSYGAAVVAGVFAAIVAAGGRGPNDLDEIGVGVAVAVGLVSLVTPLHVLMMGPRDARA